MSDAPRLLVRVVPTLLLPPLTQTMLRSLSSAVLSVLCLTALATAQDLAVSRVGGAPGNNDFAYYGQSGGISAYSFATTSCNVGNQTVRWGPGGSSDHPVIAQNIFRIANGRLEQLGYSFLKHGFCAVNETTCGSCQGTPCNTLGIGCADTYWATLNDGQDGGSKTDINPTTGAHTDPQTDASSGNFTIRGRCQVQSSEAGNPGAIYIAEAQYVSEHDHGAGNGRNNVSWRRINLTANSISGASYPNNMFDPAMYAWQDFDPAVNINEVVNANEGGAGIDGHYVVGYKTTNLGGGLWRYEYAVHNLTSDRSMGAFSIPAPCAGVGYSDFFFRDVDSHSGDPYATTDWTVSTTGGEVRWSTQAYGQNVNANALRWGTMYNFGFTADSAPTAASAELELFKPGTPNSLFTTVQAPCGAGDPCGGDDAFENNDTCANAAIPGLGTNAGLIAIDGDEDWYQISVLDGERLDLTATFTHANGNLDMELYTNCVSLVDSSTSTTDDEFVTWTNNTGGTVDVAARVWLPSGSGCGVYALEVDVIQPPACGGDDAFEQNDSCGTAAAIPLGLTSNLVAVDGDVDYYTYSVLAGETLNVTALFSHAGGDIDLALRSANCAIQYDLGDSTSDNESVSWTNNTGGAVDVRVQVYLYPAGSGSGCGYYALDVGIDAPPACGGDDAFENNDSCGAAAALGAGATANLILVDGDEDYYSIALADGQTVEVTADFAHSQGNIDLQLWNSGCTALFDVSNSTTNDEFVTWTNSTGSAASVTLLAYLGASGNTGCGFYSLEIDVIDPPPCGGDDPFEDNDVCGNAATVTAGTTSGLVAVDADADYYRFTVPATSSVEISAVFNHSGGNVDMRLFAANCSTQLDTSTSNSDDETVSWVNSSASPQDVIVEIYLAPQGIAQGCGFYELEIGTQLDPCLGATDDGLEQNDVCSSSVPLSAGFIANLFVDKADADWWELTVPNGVTMSLDLFFNHSDADVELRLYDNCADGDAQTNWLVQSTSSSDNEAVQWTNSSGAVATYYAHVYVREAGVGNCADYSLDLSGGILPGLGTRYCNANANSSGLPASIFASGSDTVADNDLDLHVDSMPAGRFGYFLMSNTQGFIPLFGGSQGNFCLGAPFVRFSAFGQVSTAQGTLDFAPDLTALPNNTTIFPGQSWNFQCWFRDVNPTSTSNTTDAVEIQFN